jgi:hypothetical protein
MSSYLKNLTPSTESKPVSFKHIPFNVKIQYPFDNTKVVGMIAGGTGEGHLKHYVLIVVMSELKIEVFLLHTNFKELHQLFRHCIPHWVIQR